MENETMQIFCGCNDGLFFLAEKNGAIIIEGEVKFEQYKCPYCDYYPWHYLAR